MGKALTDRVVAQAKPAAKRREIPDGIVAGLYLVVQPSGAKSWALRYRFAGRPRKATLGPYPTLPLLKARQSAREALDLLSKGGDPGVEKKVARRQAAEGRDLFENVADLFLARHMKARRSYAEIKRLLDRDITPRWRGRRIQSIARRDVIELLDAMVDRGIGRTANITFSVLRKLFRWCVERDILDVTPLAGMHPPAPEVSRDRVLTDDEIRWFWKAAGDAGWPFGPLARLLLVTGQRLGEVGGMSDAEIDAEAALWSLPRHRVKNDRAHDVALSELAREILDSLPRLAGPRRLVFTTTGETPVSGFSRAKRSLDKAMLALARKAERERGGDPEKVEIGPWTLHDLRRTAATGMQRIGTAPHIIEAVLNHKTGKISGIAAIYSRHDYAEEKRAALDAWARALLAIVDGRPVTNVVPLAKVA